MFKNKNSVILILILFVCFSFSFCTNKAPQELIALSVGYLPSLAASPLYSAIVKGYFKEEGLNVRIQEIYSGPELVNALQGKAIDIAFGIVPPLVLSRSRGIAIKSICGATIDGAHVREHRLMLPPDSEIKKGIDLKGKKIAVVAEGTSDYFGLLQYLDKNGLSIKDVEIIKTSHPDMIFAIASKSVDAACGIEPFITTGKLLGKIKVFDFYYPDEPTEIGTYLAHEDFLALQPKIAEKFIRAIKKGIQYAQNHEELRKLLPRLEEYGIKFKLTEKVAKEVTIMEFKDSLTEKGIESIMNQLIEFGHLKEPIDVSACIYNPEN